MIIEEQFFLSLIEIICCDHLDDLFVLGFSAELTKIIQNYYQIFPLILSSVCGYFFISLKWRFLSLFGYIKECLFISGLIQKISI